MVNDSHYMNMAIGLAEKGRGFTSPNPMVGAVVVKNGQVVGKGYHEEVGGPHAEVNAIDDAGDHAKGAVLYVTLEPCNHTGRTPPCTKKIIEAGIKRVVVAMPDPNPRVAGGGDRYLMEKGIDVLVGVCREEAIKLNEAFIKHVTTGKPFTILKCAVTLDGRIATKTGDAKWITNEMSRRHVHQMRHAVDAIMVGIGTVRADNPSLTTRLPGLITGKKGRNPMRVIVDTRLSITPDAIVIRTKDQAQTLLVTGEGQGDINKKDFFLKEGIQILEAPMENGKIRLASLMDRLGEMNITSLLIEGGGGISGSALSGGFVDRIMMFYAPKIYGGDDGVPVFRGTGPTFMRDCHQIKNIEVKRFGDDIMIQGEVVYHQS